MSATGRCLRAFTARVVALLALSLLPRSAEGQFARDGAVDWLVSAGSEAEQYLRTLQLAALAPRSQWSIRPFSMSEMARMAPQVDSAHPWSGQFRLRDAMHPWIRAVSPQVALIFNSTFPYGLNDGPVWTGRGVTIVVSAGLEGSAGPLEYRIAPVLFAAQNAAFPLVPSGLSGPLAFADPYHPTTIDLPQRFGAAAYGRLDAGESMVSVGAFRVRAGVTTGSEWWGPAFESPFLLSNNAGGFEHVFFGTDGPVSLGPITLNARVIGGRLEQSSYSSAASGATRRTLAGAVATVASRFVPGLEIGAGRLFEDVYTPGHTRLGAILSPLFENILKSRLSGSIRSDSANQLASVFARWAPPASGFEIYGELGREDHSYDTRDLLLEPDHDLAYTLGFQRVWRRGDGRLLLLRAELMNSDISSLYRVRAQGPPYMHTPIRQGHTQRGQLLGAAGGYAGGTTVVEAHWLTNSGDRSIAWRRIPREPTDVPAGPRDVVHALTAGWTLFRTPVDLRPEATVAYELNGERGPDRLNFRLALAGTAHW